jgi:transposase-like protein
VANLGEKFSWWEIFSKNWSKKKAKLAPWMEEGVRNLLAQIGSCSVLWIPNTTNVFPLSSRDNRGGYGVVRKV